jgi:nucleoside recognition membrane protein YjiH
MSWYLTLLTFLLYSVVMAIVATIYINNCDKGYIPTKALRVVLWMYIARAAVIFCLMVILFFTPLALNV